MSESTIVSQFEDLEKMLTQQFRNKVRNVHVVQRGGQVVLQGFAVSYYAKQLAQHLVLSVLETKSLVNELEVQRPMSISNGEAQT